MSTLQSSPIRKLSSRNRYSSLHSGRSLALDHFCGNIDDPCGLITDFCGVINYFWGVFADPCGIVATPEAIGGHAVTNAAMQIIARLTKNCKTLLNIVEHHETLVKHYNMVKRGKTF